MRLATMFLVLSTPLLAQESGFSFDRDFESAAFDYEVTVSGAFGSYVYTEQCWIEQGETEIELRRNPMLPMTVPIEGGTMSVARSVPVLSDVTFVYDREWRPLRVDGWVDALGPELGGALEVVLGPAANLVQAELDSPAGPGAMDPASFVAQSPLWPGTKMSWSSWSNVEEQGWRAENEIETLGIEEVGGKRLARVRWTSRYELTGFLAAAVGPLAIERESLLHASGFPETATWVLRVGSTELLRIERRQVEDPIARSGAMARELEETVRELAESQQRLLETMKESEEWSEKLDLVPSSKPEEGAGYGHRFVIPEESTPPAEEGPRPR